MKNEIKKKSCTTTKHIRNMHRRNPLLLRLHTFVYCVADRYDYSFVSFDKLNIQISSRMEVDAIFCYIDLYFVFFFFAQSLTSYKHGTSPLVKCPHH